MSAVSADFHKRKAVSAIELVLSLVSDVFLHFVAFIVLLLN